LLGSGGEVAAGTICDSFFSKKKFSNFKMMYLVVSLINSIDLVGVFKNGPDIKNIYPNP
jgi:uncharacterized membrane protein YeaQ/YmgE (transglycosylase-associated protein family)